MSKWNNTLAITIMTVTLAGCANMTHQQKNTAIGATLGGIAGSVLTNGSPVGTVGGAVVGGVIGNKVKR